MLNTSKNPLFIEVTTEESVMISGGNNPFIEAEGNIRKFSVKISNPITGQSFLIYKSSNGDQQENGLYLDLGLLALP